MPSEDLSEDRQKQILDAAIEEFAQHGFHETRMEDIARASGLSKGALYLYYKSKDAIIAALLRRLFVWELRGTQAIVDSEGSATDRLVAITRMFADELEGMEKAMPIFLEFYAVALRHASVRNFISEMYDQYRTPLVTLVEQGIARGEFRPVVPDEVAIAWIALFEGLTLLWAMNPHGIAWRKDAESALRLLIDGLRLR